VLNLKGKKKWKKSGYFKKGMKKVRGQVKKGIKKNVGSKLNSELYLHNLSLNVKNIKIYSICKCYQYFGFKNLSFMLIWINKLKLFNKDKK